MLMLAAGGSAIPPWAYSVAAFAFIFGFIFLIVLASYGKLWLRALLSGVRVTLDGAESSHHVTVEAAD